MRITKRKLDAKFGDSRFKNEVRARYFRSSGFARLLFRRFPRHPSSVRSLCQSISYIVVYAKESTLHAFGTRSELNSAFDV